MESRQKREKESYSRAIKSEKDDKNEIKRVDTLTLGVYSLENPVMGKLLNGKDIFDDLVDVDDEIEKSLTGKKLPSKKLILLDKDDDFVYNYSRYNIIKDDKDKVIKEEKEKKVHANINDESNPLRIIRKIGKKEALQQFVFKYSYQLRHYDGLSYSYLKNIATELYKNEELALIAPLEQQDQENEHVRYKPVRIRLREGSLKYWAWLEGRLDEKGEYALIMHLTDLELD